MSAPGLHPPRNERADREEARAVGRARAAKVAAAAAAADPAVLTFDTVQEAFDRHPAPAVEQPHP